MAPAPHPEWGDHDARLRTRLDPGWIVSTWALCVLAAFVVAGLGAVIVSMFSETPLMGETNSELGVLTILSAMGTFIGFVVVLTIRLVKVQHDRLSNSLAVPILHVAVAIALFAVNLALESAGMGLGDVFEGDFGTQLGNVFTVIERSAAAAILAGLLAAGMVPAVGARPSGTQVGATPQDRQL